MNCQADIAAIVCAKRKMGFSEDGSVFNKYGKRQEITLLPVKQFLQFPALLQSLTGESETVEYLPILLFGVDGGGILQLGQIVIKGNAYLCQLSGFSWLCSMVRRLSTPYSTLSANTLYSPK